MRKKKPAKDLTTEEAIKRIFPAKAVSEAKKAAHERDKAGEAKPEKPPKKPD